MRSLRHGHDALTCQVRAISAHVFDVSVVPHWNHASAVRQRFQSANEAVRRHAEIVAMLCARGWNATEYGHARPTGITAA